MQQQPTKQVRKGAKLTKHQHKQLEDALSVRGTLQEMENATGIFRQTIQRIRLLGRGDSDNVRKILQYLAGLQVQAA